ncbi:unnamed protein product [Allacma fusca]|uniref:Prolyl endopeptidase n=1 Tax=Allacma fusca TaxID=39272 RepID=A0A8J2LJA9_9HEXA|nr:unnamed protein product [Allacma fusca]
MKLTEANQERIKYPTVRRNETVIEYIHGYSIKDPYRWLEDPDSEETKKFIQEQNQLTTTYLEGILDRERIGEKCQEIWNFPRFHTAPAKAGDYYYFWKSSGLQNQGVIYSLKDPNDEPEVFFDPNTLSPDGRISLRNYYFSKSGKVFAYCLSENGTDWKVCHFKNVETGVHYPEKLEGLKFSTLQWWQDNQGEGFFYTAYPKDTSTGKRRLDNEQGWFHRIGTKQSEDILVLSFPQQPNWFIHFMVSDCGKYLMAFPNVDFKANGLYMTGLGYGITPAMFWIPMFTNVAEASYEYITNNGSLFYFKTDKKSPRFQIIQIETERTRNPRFLHYTTLVPEHPRNVLSTVRAVADNKLFLVYIEDMKNKIEVRNLKDGSMFQKVPLDMGTVWSISRRVKNQQELFFLFESFATPSRVHRCNFTADDVVCEVYKETQVANLDVSNIETKLVFYPSFDNTSIPMFIVQKKGVVNNGTSPLLLYGYGGFNSNTQTIFEIGNLIFIKYFDGIYATPGLRGGGEYGEDWHAAGSLLNKKNTFRDFQAAAEYLIKEKYTSSSKLVVTGTSNGGLLVGAAVNKKPELYAVAIAKVGVMDMLRYNKLGVGFWWTEEYGLPEIKEHFDNLRSYSPLHNVQKYVLESVQYPAILVLTGDHDDRVVPAHSYKYAAELQYRIGNLSQQKKPLLLKVETNVGHSLGQIPALESEEWADMFAFISKNLNVEFSHASGNSLTISIFSVLTFVIIDWDFTTKSFTEITEIAASAV